MNARNEVAPHFRQLEPSTLAESSSTWEIDNEIIGVSSDSSQTDSVLGNAMRTLIDLDGCAGLEEEVRSLSKQSSNDNQEKRIEALERRVTLILSTLRRVKVRINCLV